MKLIEPGLYRGVRPETDEQRQVLLDAGIKSILSLESDWWEIIHGKQNSETRWAVAHGITIQNLELSPLFKPSRADLLSAVEIMRSAPRPLYVHCKEGVDRTGMACATYRLLTHNWSFEQAKNEMISMGFHMYRYWWWISRLRELDIPSK